MLGSTARVGQTVIATVSVSDQLEVVTREHDRKHTSQLRPDVFASPSQFSKDSETDSKRSDHIVEVDSDLQL